LVLNAHRHLITLSARRSVLPGHAQCSTLGAV